jgi:hypothetical protein
LNNKKLFWPLTSNKATTHNQSLVVLIHIYPFFSVSGMGRSANVLWREERRKKTTTEKQKTTETVC